MLLHSRYLMTTITVLPPNTEVYYTFYQTLAQHQHRYRTNIGPTLARIHRVIMKTYFSFLEELYKDSRFHLGP